MRRWVGSFLASSECRSAADGKHRCPGLSLPRTVGGTEYEFTLGSRIMINGSQLDPVRESGNDLEPMYCNAVRSPRGCGSGRRVIGRGREASGESGLQMVWHRPGLQRKMSGRMDREKAQQVGRRSV